MKIDSVSTNPGGEPRRIRRAAPPPSSAPDADQPADQQDAINLSNDARRIVQMPRTDPERARLIARLREEVGGGTYKPDAEAIARRIAERLKP